MTPGQERALREFDRIQAVDPDAIELVGLPVMRADHLSIEFSFRIGAVERRAGGLPLRERESFVLAIAPDYPFEEPTVLVTHDRFEGFPHVTWTRFLCLYQSKMEWNPSDGLFGLFDRLSLWLTRAALNDMDPVEGPLEPPHYATDSSGVAIVIRANAPVEAGEQWVGWAQITGRANLLEITGWRALGQSTEIESQLALAVFLPKPMPMEFPQTGRELFAAFTKAGLDRALLLDVLALAAYMTPEGEPTYLVMGFPMRRSADGSPRQHIAVWSTTAEYSKSLRLSIPEMGDSEALLSARADLKEAIWQFFEVTNIRWNQVLEDRNEILVRRDARTSAAHLRGKRILILGCGALGSWAAEFIARAAPACLDLVDNGIVKPGLLARQNFTRDDVGSNKAQALAGRIKTLASGMSITPHPRNAHRFLMQDLERTASYDLIIDCTASSILQMKLERDWSSLRAAIRRLISFELDASAHRCVAVSLGADSAEGPWSVYLRLKYKLCAEEPRPQLARAFYDPAALGELFQPEPGCSDPTFSGSAIDVANITATALNLCISRHQEGGSSMGAAFTLASQQSAALSLDVFDLAPVLAAEAGAYRVLISTKALNRARAAVRQNARLRSPEYETGGLLWGYWDDAAQLILVLDASGPPPDSRHDPGHFVCGTSGTKEEHHQRATSSRGVCKFVGFWHTHPNVPPQQSAEDIGGMTLLVGQVGQKQRRSVMLILGRVRGVPSAGLYVYESRKVGASEELLEVGFTQIPLNEAVV